MGTGRQSRPSELTVDSIYQSVRNLDKLVWNGGVWAVEDIQEYADNIKRKLDEMVVQYKMETNYPITVPTPKPNPPCQCGCAGETGHNWTLDGLANKLSKQITPFPEPTVKKSEWQSTPIIPLKKD